MPKSTQSVAVLPEKINLEKIYIIRGQKVMLDGDLEEMYGVEVRVLNQAVKRNASRFPKDFMFRLSSEEFSNLKSQIVISSWGGRRKLPNAFTEQGVAMLSSVLNSETAIQVIPIAIGTNYPVIHQNETTYYRQQRHLDEN